jgi:hypothetical protein
MTGFGIESVTQQRDRFGSKFSIARHQCQAAEAPMERNRSIRAQKCGAVGGTGPVELGNKAFAEPVPNRHRVPYRGDRFANFIPLAMSCTG